MTLRTDITVNLPGTDTADPTFEDAAYRIEQTLVIVDRDGAELARFDHGTYTGMMVAEVDPELLAELSVLAGSMLDAIDAGDVARIEALAEMVSLSAEQQAELAKLVEATA